MKNRNKFNPPVKLVPKVKIDEYRSSVQSENRDLQNISVQNEKAFYSEKINKRAKIPPLRVKSFKQSKKSLVNKSKEFSSISNKKAGSRSKRNSSKKKKSTRFQSPRAIRYAEYMKIIANKQRDKVRSKRSKSKKKRSRSSKVNV